MKRGRPRRHDLRRTAATVPGRPEPRGARRQRLSASAPGGPATRRRRAALAAAQSSRSVPWSPSTPEIVAPPRGPSSTSAGEPGGAGCRVRLALPGWQHIRTSPVAARCWSPACGCSSWAPRRPPWPGRARWSSPARAVQGLGAAFVAPAALSLLTTTFAEGRPRERTLAVFGAATAAGAVAGVVASGLVTDAFGWRVSFTVSLVLAVGAAVALAGGLVGGLLIPSARPVAPPADAGRR